MPQPLTRDTMPAAEAHLRAACPVMDRLIADHGRCPLADTPRDPFETLATSIICQQLSAKAAATIEGRVRALLPDFGPASLAVADPDALRGAGLSGAKARYVTGLAQRVLDGRLPLDGLGALDDEQALALVTSVPGIGRWTAEMFLIFCLHRPDVLALGDAGLQRSARLLFGDEVDLAAAGERWRPFRSVASWYLWRHLEPPSPQPPDARQT